MTHSQFISNLQGTGEHYPKELLKVAFISKLFAMLLDVHRLCMTALRNQHCR